jgi:Protein of unknown function (DUF2516)
VPPLLEQPLQWLLIAVVVWALVDAAARPTAAFVAAGKQTKLIWLGILALALVLAWFGGVLGLGLVSAVAAGVYLADVRPAVRDTRPGGPWG